MTIEDVKKKYGITQLHIFPGTNPSISEEEVAKEIEKSIVAILNGDCEEV